MIFRLRRRSAVALLGAALLLASCRSTPLTLPLAEVVPPGTENFALDPIPTPWDADLSDRVAPLGRVWVSDEFDAESWPVLLRIFPRHDLWAAFPGDADTILRPAPLPGGPEEAFELTVRRREQQVEIILRSAGSIGQRWAAETLGQLICRGWNEPARFVRLGTIRDRPGFPLRGNKRPLPFEQRYRANLSWENPGHEHFVPVLSPGGVLDVTEAGLRRAREFLLAGHRQGARRFAIEFDDVGFDLTEETRDLYGSYFFALTAYLRACREMLRQIDPDAVLYWLPQTYWTNAKEFGEFANQVGLAGGVPADLGLVLTGPEVISGEIPAADIARARRRLGLTETKAIIYDNLGREGDFGPLRGRGADLLAEVDGVFGERGEVLHRITRLDYSWNPEAYDPERSLLLACREVVGISAAPYLQRLVLEIDALPPEEAAWLLRQVELRFLSDPGGPVRRDEYLQHLRNWLAKRLNIDPLPKCP